VLSAVNQGCHADGTGPEAGLGERADGSGKFELPGAEDDPHPANPPSVNAAANRKPGKLRETAWDRRKERTDRENADLVMPDIVRISDRVLQKPRLTFTPATLRNTYRERKCRAVER
jgi:hypothetical protein